MLTIHGKGGNERRVPDCGKLVALLRDHLAGRGAVHPGDPLLISRTRARLTVKAVNRLFARWVRDAGLDGYGYTPHSARHGMASLLEAHGLTVFEIMDFLGHRDPKTTMQYVHGSAATVRGKLEAHDVFSEGEPAPASSGAPQASPASDQIAQLQDQIGELTALVSQLVASTKAA